MKHFHHLRKFQCTVQQLYSVLGYNSFPFTCFVFLAYSSLHYPFSLPNLSYSFNLSGEEKSPTLANNRTCNSLTHSKQVLLFIPGILQFFIILKVTDTISYSFEAFSINLIKITWNLQNPEFNLFSKHLEFCHSSQVAIYNQPFLYSLTGQIFNLSLMFLQTLKILQHSVPYYSNITVEIPVLCELQHW